MLKFKKIKNLNSYRNIKNIIYFFKCYFMSAVNFVKKFPNILIDFEIMNVIR